MITVGRAVRGTVSGLPREFWWLWTGTLVNRAGAFVVIFLAIYLTQSLGYSTALTGLVIGAAGAGSLLAGVGAGQLADRLGRRPVLLWSQVASAATLVGFGVTTAPWAVVVLSGLFGMFSNAARPALSAMVADLVPPRDRLRAFSLNYWAVNLGFAVAAILGGLLASTGYLTLFLLDAVTTLVFAVVVFLRVPESHPGMTAARPGAVRADPAATVSAIRTDGVFLAFMALTFAFAVVFMQHMSTLPVQMAEDGLDPSQFGLVISLNALLIVVVTLPTARVVQRFPTAPVLALAGVFVGLGFGATAWASTMTTYALTVVIWTIGEVIGSSLGPAVVAELSPASMRGRYQGAFTSTFSLAAFVAPVAGGWVYDSFGGRALWLGCAGLSFVSAAGHLLAGPARSRRLAALATTPAPAPAHPPPPLTT